MGVSIKFRFLKLKDILIFYEFFKNLERSNFVFMTSNIDSIKGLFFVKI